MPNSSTDATAKNAAAAVARPPSAATSRTAASTIAMAVAPGEACYVPLGHRASSEAFDFGAHAR